MSVSFLRAQILLYFPFQCEDFSLLFRDLDTRHEMNKSKFEMLKVGSVKRKELKFRKDVSSSFEARRPYLRTNPLEFIIL